MKIYEYIFAAVIMVAILIAAIFLTGISPHIYKSISEVEQLKMAAQKIMAQLLLSPGDPEDWGKDINIRAEDLSSFGLAVSTVFTRDVYVLDQDKVQRLGISQLSQLYVPPGRVLKLWNLGFNYGIKIEFIPALNIIVSLDGSNVTIMVLSEQGVPASYMNVTVVAFSIEEGEIRSLLRRVFDNDGDGTCTIKFPFSPRLLIVVADYYGVVMSRVYESSLTYTSYLIGRFIIGPQLDIANNGIQVFALRLPNGTFTLMNVGCGLHLWENPPISGYNVYNVSFVEPNVVAVVTRSDNRLVVAYKVVPRVYSSIPGDVFPPLAYMLERSVRIGLSTYTLRLSIWRMFW